MLVILSFALVLAATVLLVLGLLSDDGLALIYASIACSVGAAIVLIAALRRNRPRADISIAPVPLLSVASAGIAPTAEPLLATATAPAPAPAPAAAAAAEWQASDWEEGEEVDFPIADYDDLTAGQILPLLPQLYADEIDVVEAREQSSKARPEILDRLAQLRGDDAPSLDEPTVASAAAVGWAGGDTWFPIEDYDSLSAAQIRPLLGELDDEELGLVRTREMALGRRRSLLDEIDRRLAGTTAAAAPEAVVTPAPMPAPSVATAPAPVKKAPVKKAPAKKVASTNAPAKKAAAAKKASPAKKAPAKKASAATKAPAAKTAPAKAVAKKAAPAKKAPATKKTPATTSAPAKKAP